MVLDVGVWWTLIFWYNKSANIKELQPIQVSILVIIYPLFLVYLEGGSPRCSNQ